MAAPDIIADEMLPHRGLTGGRIVIATGNRDKLREFARLFSGRPFETVPLAEFAIEPAAETAPDFRGNARLKAVRAATSGLPALADDSGLCVDALGGQPGIFSADWAETAHGRDYSSAMERIRVRLEAMATPMPQPARFCCALCVAWPDGHCETFTASLPGEVVWPPRGEGGFGYDPIFVPDGKRRTLAQMSAAEKDHLSHRATAARRFAAACLDRS